MSQKQSFITLLIISVITALSAFLVSILKVDYNFEAYFPQNNPETEFYLEFRKSFETDNDFFFVALENREGIFEESFLKDVDRLADELKSVPHMTEVLSPTQLQEYIRDPFMGTVFRDTLLKINAPESYDADSARIYSTPGLVGVFFSEDGKSLAINMKHEQQLSKAKSDELCRAVEQILSTYRFDQTHVIGRALGQKMYVEMMVGELAMFISISLLLTIFFLFIAFRSGWGILIPTLVVLIAIIWTLGFVKLIGKDIDLMMTILPTIIFVVGMSDSVHVLTKYMQELRNGKEKIEAIRYAFKSIRLATFLTALTTSVGFLTLSLSNIKPISDFGIYTAVGVMLAYGLTYTMLPAILILAKPKRMFQYALADDFWTRRLHRFFSWLLEKRRQVLIGGLAVLLISGVGIYLIKVDNMMLEDLRDTHLLKREFRFMEEHFAGCRPFELAIQLREGVAPMDRNLLIELDSLDAYLQTQYGVGCLMSVPAMVKMANKTYHGGQDEYYTIPDSQQEIDRIGKYFSRNELKEFSALYINKEKGLMRISGKCADLGRRHYETENEDLLNFAQLNGHSMYKPVLTGTAHLIDLNNKVLVENMVWDLLLSVLIIGLIMGVVYKSWKMIILTIVPNLVPLLVVAGIMGFLGIPIKISTSIIFNIAFGIAVDDTVHFLARVRTFLNDGLSVNYAVKRTFLTTGKAMIVTTLILSGGFLTLIFSDFLGTFYIGLLISLTLFIAIFAELLFTPLIVMFFYRK